MSITMNGFVSDIDHLALGRCDVVPDDVVEIPFLLPAWQAARLESEAHRHGLTTAQMVRRLILDRLRGALDACPESHRLNDSA